MVGDTAPLHRLQRLTAVLLLSFAGIALALGWWGTMQRETLAAREDNPRGVEAELRIERGRIFDSSGEIVLAETVADGERLRRSYPLTVAAPAVGYYSFRYGTAGVEQGLDGVLRGESEEDVWTAAWRELLNEPQRGRDVRLTLDAAWQAAASDLLGDHHGAVVLVTIPGGAVRVLLSHPLYDPNQLDEQFDQLTADSSAPLVNRVTQAQYQPGLILEPFVLAAALDQDLIGLNDPVEASNEPVEVSGQTMRCLAEPETADWAGVLANACPAPLLELSPQLGITGLNRVFVDFGLTRTPTMAYLPLADGPTTTIDEPAAAIIGQENLTVSPLQVVVAWTALANNGVAVEPRLVSAVQNEEGEWAGLTNAEPAGEPLVTAETAAQIREALPQWERTREYTTLVLSGPEGGTNGWYLGLAPITEPRYALVVVVEEAAGVEVAQNIGRELLQVVLAN